MCLHFTASCVQFCVHTYMCVCTADNNWNRRISRAKVTKFGWCSEYHGWICYLTNRVDLSVSKAFRSSKGADRLFIAVKVLIDYL